MSKDKRVSLQDKQDAMEAGITQFDDSDMLALDPSLLKELKDQNLSHRWINAKKWKDNYGFDPRMWAPYKRKSTMAPGYEAFGVVDSEGYTRRGDLILATQKQEVAEKRKAKIASKNKALMGDQSKLAADSLRQDLKGKGRVIEGYDENE